MSRAWGTNCFTKPLAQFDSRTMHHLYLVMTQQSQKLYMDSRRTTWGPKLCTIWNLLLDFTWQRILSVQLLQKYNIYQCFMQTLVTGRTLMMFNVKKWIGYIYDVGWKLCSNVLVNTVSSWGFKEDLRACSLLKGKDV